jgi:membrane protease YdiL (CAAX protease family)
MPVKLTSTQYKIIGIVIAVAAASLAIGVKYFWRAFPEAAIEFRVNRADSEPIASKFAAERGAQLAGYRHAAIFSYDDDAKVYLERTQGLERMNTLTKGPVHLWRWSHRWFKPLQKEEYRVDVTPAGQVVGFDHEIPEAAPGANLDPDQARSIAEDFLRNVMHRDLAGLEFLEKETEKRPARTDYSYTWKEKDVELGGGSYRISVEVDGDQVAAYNEFVKVPEQWSRDYEKLRSRNVSAQLVDEVFMFTLMGALVVILLLRLRDRDVPVRLAVVFGLVAASLYFLGQLNNFGLEQFGYPTTDSYSSFMGNYLLSSILGALGLGAAIFVIVAGAEPVYRANLPRLVSFRRYLSWEGLRTRSFFMANVVGIGLTFFFFAYQTVFYLAANKLGAWAPAEVNYSDLLNTHFPWVWVLFVGFFPAVSEEMMFRMFAIPFLRKFLRSLPLAIILAAFIWGFGHSGYPNQPFYIRGLEVGIGGIIIGILMLRFGVLTTLIWHYSVDALYTAFLLLRSHNSYLMVSGGVTAGIMLIPLVLALVVYLKTGTFVDEERFTNATEGVSRPPHEEAAAQEVTSLAYHPLTMRRLVAAGILTAGFVALAFIPVQRFGKGIKIRVGRPEATRLAEAYLQERHVDLRGYRHAAWLQDNLDPLAIRYMLERRTIQQTDQIYRQATKLVLWRVRFFRPLQKEEHLVMVDPSDGKVFAYWHTLDEDAAGAALTPDQAQALAEKAVVEHGYSLSDFELQDSQSQKRKARMDYTLTWQAKAGDPRNVGDDHYRLVVNIAGDQVTSFARHFKLPETWVRNEQQTRVAKVILIAIAVLLGAGFVGGLLVLFVIQLKARQIAWRPSAKVGALVWLLVALLELNALPVVLSRYPTYLSWNTFMLYISVSYFVMPLLFGLLGWITVALATSFYPGAWRVFRPSDRRIWRRDALVAVVLSLAAAAGLSRLGELFAGRFHAIAPVDFSLVPSWFNTYLPGPEAFLTGLRSAVMLAAAAALVIYLVRLGLTRRTWWLALGLLLFLAVLGPSGAQSLREYFAGWVVHLVAVAVFVAIVAVWFRGNVLAYVVTAFCFGVASALVELLGEPQGFFRLNGVALVLLALFFLAWLFLGGSSKLVPASPSETPPPVQ